ncbi:basic secretory protein-like protein [Olivibacter sitiensis]|uniref:basic secretory protein-like protein n=1 Tax=Olivibacter sitiensis TaxID=376470 RepID=UPI001FE14863|nr:basic secretory protein-like protein [Olivibacter sitiensis]
MRYKTLDFKVKSTPHFDFYTYLNNDSLLRRFAQESELWYELHQQVFRDTFERKNPLILYNNHPDFQQTTATSGEISVGTGGFTEGMKNRVVMPLMQINNQTRHVLGHELVHAFQYHSLMEGDSTRLENIGNLPLWMIEGMAEYLSIGKKDAFTAMWMRDAYLNKDIPTLRDLTESGRYFPYRYGQAFWSYVGATYGDTVIVPLFKATAKYGYQNAIQYIFGYDEPTLSGLWRSSVENAYAPLLKDTAQTPLGNMVINNKNGGNMNVSPAISPDGKLIAFLSEKELFSIDLFLADAKTGRIIRNLSSRQSNSHIDEFSYIESAGSFSPDSRKFAFSIFSGGRNKLLIVNVENGKTIMTEGMGDVGEFSNITWSPDGVHVAFSGLKEGQSDIFMYNIENKTLTQLTNDPYSDYQPSFSRDGKKIVFSTDRLSYRGEDGEVAIPMTIAVLDIQSKAVSVIDVFPRANNLNPQFGSNDEHIYFLSNRDGFRNLYKYTLADEKVEQLTDYFTGISGITEYSPALSVSNEDDIIYSYYRSQRYTIYNAKPEDFKATEVSPTEVDFTAAMLPPPQSYGVDVVNTNLGNFNLFRRINSSLIKPIPYKPKFQLDYLQGSGVGVAVGSRYGAGLASGVQGIFSDILGRNQLFAGLAINGEIYDFGGQFAYINQKSRIGWGGSVSHIPYMSGLMSYGQETINDITYLTENTDIIRTFQTQVDGFAMYPFSRTTRFELGAAFARYGYRIDRFTNYYQNGYYFVGSDRRRISNEEASATYGGNFESFTLPQVNAAFVGDNSFFGVAAPLNGYRYRLAAEKYFGRFNFTAYTADLRKYNRYKPVTLAARAYTYMRVGDGEDRLFPLFIGYPFLVRGYESGSYYNNSNSYSNSNGLNQLMGSRMAVFNLEARLPFTGPERLAQIKSGMFFSDLNVFFDAGIAWSAGDKLTFSNPQKVGEQQYIDSSNGEIVTVDIYERAPVMSAGISLRVNVFGYFVLEPYYAFPFNRSDIKAGTFGLNFAPGW